MPRHSLSEGLSFPTPSQLTAGRLLTSIKFRILPFLRLFIAVVLITAALGCHRICPVATRPSAMAPTQFTATWSTPSVSTAPVVSRSLLSIPPNVVLPTEVNSQGIAAGNTAGALSVSADGDLVYDFPLWVPPGRNGVQPVLSLNYHGRGGNGLEGVGWTARCPQTTAQNGANAPIAFDNTDRFCLDGQQLFAVTGNYGTSGAEYRTERDMFAKIVSGETDGLGPKSFEVYLKDGRILFYGTTRNSRIEGQRVHTAPVDIGGAPLAQPGASTSWVSESDHVQHIA
jgi:Salmonella virulence plasmid 65kDa B protein